MRARKIEKIPLIPECGLGVVLPRGDSDSIVQLSEASGMSGYLDLHLPGFRLLLFVGRRRIEHGITGDGYLNGPEERWRPVIKYTSPCFLNRTFCSCEEQQNIKTCAARTDRLCWSLITAKPDVFDHKQKHARHSKSDSILRARKSPKQATSLGTRVQFHVISTRAIKKIAFTKIRMSLQYFTSINLFIELVLKTSPYTAVRFYAAVNNNRGRKHVVNIPQLKHLKWNL